MKIKISTILALIVLLLIAILLLSGCSKKESHKLMHVPTKDTKEECLRKRIDQALIANLYRQLPSDATNIVSLGNGWYTFELNGDKFMGRSYYHRQCITHVK